MPFETIDWEAEAKRVARAFGIKEECEFCSFTNGDWDLIQGQHFQIPLDTNRALEVSYRKSTRSRWYCITEAVKNNWTAVEISLGGEVSESYNLAFVDEMSRALFQLNLLTPEVEQALQINLSFHEKLEWTLEYDESIKNES